MLTAREAVALAAATYDGGRRPDLTGYGGAVSVFFSELGDTLAVAIEGTHDSFGWALDFAAWPIEARETVPHPTLPDMHRGFRDALLSVLPGIRDKVRGGKWTAIGHSLGGAVALALGAWLADEGTPPEAIYLFAPARVFADAPDVLAGIPVNGWRVGGDIVPMVPPWCWRPILTHLPGPADESAHAISNFVAALG